jgi:hypothetical protein
LEKEKELNAGILNEFKLKFDEKYNENIKYKNCIED